MLPNNPFQTGAAAAVFPQQPEWIRARGRDIDVGLGARINAAGATAAVKPANRPALLIQGILAAGGADLEAVIAADFKRVYTGSREFNPGAELAGAVVRFEVVRVIRIRRNADVIQEEVVG